MLGDISSLSLPHLIYIQISTADGPFQLKLHVGGEITHQTQWCSQLRGSGWTWAWIDGWESRLSLSSCKSIKILLEKVEGTWVMSHGRCWMCSVRHSPSLPNYSHFVQLCPVLPKSIYEWMSTLIGRSEKALWDCIFGSGFSHRLD